MSANPTAGRGGLSGSASIPAAPSPTRSCLADGRRVVASAKSLTTPWDLAIGIGNAIRAVLEELPAGARRADVSLVSVSTTLATNAVVENRFSPGLHPADRIR